ncbi:MAG TPA: hypothetical protein VFD09_00565 [Thiopseudomonas sp.]|nr:hypothetical protein [Thiopseudomonas sp.]
MSASLIKIIVSIVPQSATERQRALLLEWAGAVKIVMLGTLFIID